MVAKKIKPMDDVPKGVSARFAETNARLAKATASRNRSGKKITTGKAKSIAREKKYGTPSQKTAAQNESFANQYAKYAKKSGDPALRGAAAVAPKSVSPRQKKVPVKPRGGAGMRGGRGGMGFGGGAGLRGSVNK